ncbi:PEP-CTERM sorting domain-containing protein [Aquabacterium sp.]|uniref:PEP-CTERM sorting domain-containing protein n=1 Tax=Aquabacterium sp. TaxID=1872578 RepID=UPI003782D254
MPASFHRLAAAVLAAAAALPALANPVQITPGGSFFNSYAASVSDNGQRIAFYSASNITGANTDNSFEIYLYDRPTNTVTQVSNFGGGALAGGNQVPVLSGDGNRLSYQHFETQPNNTVNFQTVLYDHTTKASTTVTPMALFGGTNELSRDGKTIAVATGNTGLRLYDTATGVLGGTIAGNTFGTAMSRDGSRIALETFGALSVKDLQTNTTINITGSGAGFNLHPDFSDDGSKLAFTSTYDPLGTNADHSAEVFLYDLTTNSVRQLTASSGNVNTSSGVSLSANGSRVAFSSSADLLGTNADGNQEIFVYDLVTNVLQQVTQTSGGDYNFEAALSGDGLTLAFTSSADFSGSNGRHVPQIFFETLAPSTTVPEPASLALVLVAAAAGWGARRVPRRA